MKRSISLLMSRFAGSKRGATNIMMALAILPIMLFIGFTLDGRRVISVKAHMQSAIDAAALAGAREYLMHLQDDPATRNALAEAAVNDYFINDTALAETSLQNLSVAVSFSAEGEVAATATSRLPLVFGGLFGKSSSDITVGGAAQAGDSRKVEIILALDNTTSMFEADRFDKMRAAAKGFVDTMFDETAAPGLTAIGVVPWASVVNINSEAPLEWNAAGSGVGIVPASGSRAIPNAAFENRRKYLYAPEDTVPYAQWELDRDFAPTDWRGCIRSAPNERRVAASGSVINALSDSPVSGMRWHASWLEPELQSWWVPPADWEPNNNGGGGDPDPYTPGPGPQGFLNPGYKALIQNVALSLPANRRLRCTPTSWQDGYPGQRNVYLNETQPCATGFQEPLSETAEACVSDPNEFEYLANGGKVCEWQQDILPWDQTRAISGPNMNCPTAMLGLSGDRQQIIDKLDHMYPVPHGTQADIGLMWGLRALSPRGAWANFFGHTGANRPIAFKDPGVRKIMILLTDGQNTAPWHYEGYYGCNEADGRRGQAGNCWKAQGVSKLNRNSLDALTLDSCEAIRDDYEIELYTIAVDVSDADAIDLLGDCANDPDRFFNITSGELDSTFDSIAARELRLTR